MSQLRTAIRKNINSLDDLGKKIDDLQKIINDKRVSDDVRSLLLQYNADINKSFEECAYSFGDVIDEAYAQ